MDVQGSAESVDSTSRQNVEEFLVAVWKRALNLDHVTVDENFFEVGGDSLAALEILVAIDEQVEADVSITELYELPTIRELAGYIVDVGVR
ncbi:phosphopantetheine-binding protein [Streptomyces sp. SP17KL33]|uniref:phosphopantetheine-binding protein n=1 Tax=Streptomyces sp. SP17KL33 TaxID=3002534 RepID=UPI002E761B25|nr:phosphopantetheine-binding protein [Streptomyces sp. SP17KL33]MEE1831716.1 phosphopantetheine-binding protein [Streptomyces sp. SP17KL33]